jgi:hypothetical protein
MNFPKQIIQRTKFYKVDMVEKKQVAQKVNNSIYKTFTLLSVSPLQVAIS